MTSHRNFIMTEMCTRFYNSTFLSTQEKFFSLVAEKRTFQSDTFDEVEVVDQIPLNIFPSVDENETLTLNIGVGDEGQIHCGNGILERRRLCLA